ncbi:MAG: NUDIX hydrolase [Bacilli bacterium]|nr:NUDIX hydrolase [Bacilli bacterium]
MEWVLKRVEQQTDHPYLNFYVFHYEVGQEREEMTYFVASRNEKENLRANTKDFSFPDGVIIIAIAEQPEPSVLVIEQFRPALNAFIIEFPAGLTDKGDADMKSTAIREAKEESGIALSDVEVFCPPSPTSTGLSDELCGVVIGRVDSLGATALEHFEDISTTFVPIKKLPELLSDPKKIIALNVRLCMLYLIEKYK